MGAAREDGGNSISHVQQGISQDEVQKGSGRDSGLGYSLLGVGDSSGSLIFPSAARHGQDAHATKWFPRSRKPPPECFLRDVTGSCGSVVPELETPRRNCSGIAGLSADKLLHGLPSSPSDSNRT